MFSLVFEFYKGKKKEGKNGICILFFLGNKIENPLWGAIGKIFTFGERKKPGGTPNPSVIFEPFSFLLPLFADRIMLQIFEFHRLSPIAIKSHFLAASIFVMWPKLDQS